MKGISSAFTTSIVIGCNRGIGLELCKQLHIRGDRVVGVCRKASDELKALGLWKVMENMDITVEEDMRRLGAYNLGTVDNLWLNAGIGDGIEDSLVGGLNYGQILRSFETNAVGPLRCVQSFLPSLKRGSKVSLSKALSTLPEADTDSIDNR
jgi:NAD(P)-dependent dehydrogenase (short-subunit alcohol dehydrogenase family)